MKVLYILFFIILIACNSKETNLKNKTAIIDSISTENTHSLGTKLFLDFRKNMSQKNISSVLII